jgi:hypothetical protein
MSEESKAPFLIGELGGNALAEALSSSTNPFQTLKEFEENNGLRLKEDKNDFP